MKKIILSLMVAFCSLAANAQVYVGGEAGLWRNPDNNNTDFTIRPEIGYELSDKWDIGLSIGYAHNYDGNKKHTKYNKLNSFDVNPYARWTFAKLGPVNLFLEVGFGVETYKAKTGNDDIEVKEDAHTAWNIGVKPGLSIDVAKHLQFITHVGFLGYRDSDDHYNDHKGDGFGFNLNSNDLTIGLLYQF